MNVGLIRVILPCKYGRLYGVLSDEEQLEVAVFAGSAISFETSLTCTLGKCYLSLL